tara:strand:- start:11147 stop:11431 length:285 start_codon:yes stop_codon:yes gene_type:complete
VCVCFLCVTWFEEDNREQQSNNKPERRENCDRSTFGRWGGFGLFEGCEQVFHGGKTLIRKGAQSFDEHFEQGLGDWALRREDDLSLVDGGHLLL